jgi:hypothetical protein
MLYRPSRTSTCWMLFVSLLVVVLAGCATAPEPAPVAATASQGTVAYSNGQYKLYGSGTTASPYYWVWIPAGVTAPAPPTMTTNPTVTYPSGQYQLRGEGTTISPYYWVWVPSGSTVATTIPAPPAIPMGTMTVAQPGGQYQLYGNGTAASPYYWVWVPSGSVVPPPPPLPR